MIPRRMYHFKCSGYGTEVTVLATSKINALKILKHKLESNDEWLGSSQLAVIKDIIEAIECPNSRTTRTHYTILKVHEDVLFTSTE